MGGVGNCICISSFGSFAMLYKLPILVVVTSVISLPLIFQLYVYLYFNSKKFNESKPSISNFIKSCNE
jgi:hypothetical protein